MPTRRDVVNLRCTCAARVTVLGCVCVCVKSHLTSGVSTRPENTVTYSAGNGGQRVCGFFSETSLLQSSSTAPLKAIRTVGHFTVESVHMHYSQYHMKRSLLPLVKQGCGMTPRVLH